MAEQAPGDKVGSKVLRLEGNNPTEDGDATIRSSSLCDLDGVATSHPKIVPQKHSTPLLFPRAITEATNKTLR